MGRINRDLLPLFVRRRLSANMLSVVVLDPGNPSDAQLLREYVRRRDDAAFGRLVARHMRAVRYVAFRYTHHRQAAEDVAQAAFLVMAQRPRAAMRSAKWKRSALPWLAKVCRYAAANWRRAEERRRRHESLGGRREAAMYDPTAGVELAEAVRSALACLPRRDRRIVEWRHLSQMPWDEVARHAGTTPEAARKAGTRALSQLRVVLERRGITAGVTVIGATLAALARPAQATGAPLAIELARKVILMARIKAASAMTTIAASLVVGGAIVSNAIGDQNASGSAPAASASQGQPAVPATQPATPAGALRIGLGEGAALEVIAISDGARFWTADGVPLEKPAFEIPAVTVPVPDGMRRLFVKVVLDGDISAGEVPPELDGKIGGRGDGRLQWIPETGGGYLAAPAGSEVKSLDFYVYVSEAQVGAPLKFLVATEPWAMHELVPYTNALTGLRDFMTSGIVSDGWLTVTPPAGAITEPDFQLPAGVDPAARRTQLTVATNQRTKEVQPILCDQNGKWHAMTGGVFPISDQFFVRTFVADVPPEDAATVALLTRAMYQVEVTVAAAPEPRPNMALRRVVKPPPRKLDGVTEQPG